MHEACSRESGHDVLQRGDGNIPGVGSEEIVSGAVTAAIYWSMMGRANEVCLFRVRPAGLSPAGNVGYRKLRLITQSMCDEMN